MLTSIAHQIPYPEPRDAPDGAKNVQQIAFHLDDFGLIPSIANDAARTTAYPSPRVGQVIWHVAAAEFQMYRTTGWQKLTKFAAMPTIGYGMAATSGTVSRPSKGWHIAHGTYTGLTDADGKIAVPLPAGAIPGTVLGAIVSNGNQTQTNGKPSICKASPTTDKNTLYVQFRQGVVIATTTVTVNYVVWGY